MRHLLSRISSLPARWPMAWMLLLTATFLLLGHSVMAFSDPNHWIFRAVRWSEGQPESRRVLLFPMYLAAALKLVGPAWVFVANLPLLVGFAWLLGILTQRICARSGDTDGAAGFAFVAGVGLLLFLLAQPLLVAVNPYREAGAFLLLFAGFIAFLRGDRDAKGSWALLAGLACGASVGFRETTLICFIPLGVWTLVRLGLERGVRRRWAWLACLVLGGLAGLSPSFYQNWRYSGNALVPAYSAHLVVTSAEDGESLVGGPIEQGLAKDKPRKIRFDLSKLVPGMEPSMFVANFPRTLRAIREQFGKAGLFLLAVGLLAAAWRKDKVVWGLLVPAAVLNALFYSCYWYVKIRYLLIVMVFLAPIAALGLVALVRGALRLARVRGNAWTGLSLIAALLCTGWSAWSLSKMPPGMKVWQIGTFRDSLLPHLRENRRFVGYYHHRELLSWLVDRDFNHGPLGAEINIPLVREKGLDAGLLQVNQLVRASLAAHENYLYGPNIPALLPLWAEVERVVNLGELPVRAYHYRRPLDGWLYRVKAWEGNERSWNVPLAVDGLPQVLLVNPRRIWDDPARTRCSLFANGQPVAERLENDAQFIALPPLPASEGGLRLECRSDAPLPTFIPSKLWGLDQELELELGMRPLWWFHRLLSPELKHHAPMRGDACMLWDHGAMTLPHFAQSNRWTFAELRVEFFQEDPHFRNQPHQVSAAGRSWPLPPARSQSRAVFPLGQGRDALDWTRLDLRTSLPDIAEQTRMGERKEIASHAFVKIFDARIFTVPGPDAQGRRVTVGDADSGAYLEEGFYWAEKHLGKYPTRWTFPTARLRLPAHAAPGGMELRLSHFEPRRGETTPVRVLWNGRELACERTVSDGETLLTARLPADGFQADGWQELVLESPAWSPAEKHGSADTRQLGIMLHRVDILPLSAHALP